MAKKSLGSKRAHRGPKAKTRGNCDQIVVQTPPITFFRLYCEILDHPPYSPDMAPSDFYLFRSLEHWLRGKKFRTIEEMRQSLTEFFDSKDREWYRHGIHRLEEQWQKVIENHGEYFDY
jgi:hypothetical protein